MAQGIFDRVRGELAAREKSPGLNMADILALPDALARLCNWMLRQRQVTLGDIAAFLQQDEAQAQAILANLIERGYVLEIEIRGVTQYRVRLAPKRGRALPSNLWQALSDKVEGEEEAQS